MDTSQFEVTLANVEVRLRRLRTLYDQYFAGVERTEPYIERQEVERLMDQLRRNQPRNTALRFRFNQVVQRFTTYNNFWQRTRRQIEEGTFKRDVLRARRRFGDPRARKERGLDITIDVEPTLDSLDLLVEQPAGNSASAPAASASPEAQPTRSLPPPAAPAASSAAASNSPVPAKLEPKPLAEPRPHPAAPNSNGAQPLGIKPAVGTPSRAAPGLSLAPPPPSGAMRSIPPRAPAPAGSLRPPPAAGAASTVKSVAPPAPAPKSGAPSTPAAASGPSEAQIAALYQRYVDARRKNQERTDNVKIESIAKTVRDMMPKLAQKHAGKRIDFEVVLKDGRVALKPVTK